MYQLKMTPLILQMLTTVLLLTTVTTGIQDKILHYRVETVQT